ncbi:HNH endonuclease [Candidatus Saccharibacteria bacterium]|nr:HNH endonuclease [Candidatus Saccharibacteria bacterium]
MTITTSQRQQIRQQAGGCCEYCRVSEDDRLANFQIDHIIPIKHGGTDESENLCLACLKCNSFKGPNVAALDPNTGEATKLFNPRKQHWHDHFDIQEDATILGITPEGRATVAVLRMNYGGGRMAQRRMSMDLGEYPCARP